MDAKFRNLIGRRIRLLDDERFTKVFTKLHFGSLGTIEDISMTSCNDIIVWCKWDEGYTLALNATKDSFEFVEQK